MSAHLTVGVPVRNQLPFVRACLETLTRHRTNGTRLLLVDDDSEAKTREYLESFAAGVPDVDLIRNHKHSGFPYSANEILYHGSGDTVCVLNSDTLVTPGWDRLVLEAMALDDTFALAGPSTSFCHTAQEIAGLRSLRMEHDGGTAAGIAEVLARIYCGQYQRVRRLSGFCLFLRRALLDRVGYFDERFGLGCGEEDDFVDRACRLGVTPIWVKSSYVHHFGHCSFTAELGTGSAALWSRNRELLVIKQLTPGMGEVIHSMSKRWPT
jgi:O-antigen biosynthesis protein